MPNTIEVPISLIQAGDLDAIRELLPNAKLFGRWAEHPQYGRGIIVSPYPDRGGVVWFFIERKDNSGNRAAWLHLEDLTLDPVELTTLADFENAPDGTVISGQNWERSVWIKLSRDTWMETGIDDLVSNSEMAKHKGRVLRWGRGEQA